MYQQVMGHHYLMKSGLYKARFFKNCNPYRFIELNVRQLLGRAPRNGAEMRHHVTILQEQGYDAEIDSYLDSDEDQERFGQDVVPNIHGWDCSKGYEGRQFSWLMQLARGGAAAVKGDSAGVQSRLNKVVHANRPISGNPPSSGPAFFRSAIGTGGTTVTWAAACRCSTATAGTG